MRTKITLTVLVVATMAIAGCNTRDLNRAGTGAVIGGVGAAALGGDVATGVAVGAAAGALCDDVNVCR